MTTSALPSTRTSATSSVIAYDEPAGLAPRGTLLVLVGRGEVPTLYGRFGRRLSADAYKVRVVDVDLADLDATGDVVRSLLADPDLPAPHVLVGTDTGALLALTLATGTGVDAVVLAGLAAPGAQGAAGLGGDLDNELEARTACPAHRKVISGDAGFSVGHLGDDLPAAWADLDLAPLGLPTLVIHGDADTVTPAAVVTDVFAHASGTETHLVAGGRHDVLNDVTHRSVAATIVLFLERLKLGRDLPVIVRSAT